MRVCLLVFFVLVLLPMTVSSQQEDIESVVPRTPWGPPDLQGVWTNSTTTPLERPAEWSERVSLSPEEVAEINAQAQERFDLGPEDVYSRGVVSPRISRPGDPGTYNDFWWDRGSALPRTSLIIDPADGRIPPLTEEGLAQGAFRQDVGSWNERNLAERCLTRGVPKRPGGYNNNFQILQTPDYVVILQEMIHESRVIPLSNRDYIDKRIRLWMGDSRGHWEGDTLVVTTTNFDDRIVANSTNCCGRSGSGLRLTERFTRVGQDMIEFEYTVDDPTIYTRAWTVTLPMTRIPGPIYEYACHEGNYGLENILRGSRVEELE